MAKLMVWPVGGAELEVESGVDVDSMNVVNGWRLKTAAVNSSQFVVDQNTAIRRIGIYISI